MSGDWFVIGRERRAKEPDYIQPFTGLHLYAANSQQVLFSPDSGVTWSIDYSYLFGTNSVTGCALGYQNIHFLSNKFHVKKIGSTWSYSDVLTALSRSLDSFIDCNRVGSTIYASIAGSATDSAILKFNGISWSILCTSSNASNGVITASYAVSDNEIYIKTDSNKIFMYDGASWNDQSSAILAVSSSGGYTPHGLCNGYAYVYNTAPNAGGRILSVTAGAWSLAKFTDLFGEPIGNMRNIMVNGGGSAFALFKTSPVGAPRIRKSTAFDIQDSANNQYDFLGYVTDLGTLLLAVTGTPSNRAIIFNGLTFSELTVPGATEALKFMVGYE